MRDLPVVARPRDAALIALGAVTLQIGALAPWPTLRALIVVPAALLTPGYALLGALLGAAPRGEHAIRLGLACILSLANYPLLALALAYSGLRLTSPHILAGLDLEHAALAGAILGRSTWRVPYRGGACTRTAARPLLRRPWHVPSQLPVSLAPPLLLLPVLAGAYALVECAPASPFSQLALSGDWASISGNRWAGSTTVQVPVAVRNREGQQRTYRLTMDIDGRALRPARRLALAAGAAWSGRVAVVVPDDACVHRLRVVLSSGGDAPNTLTLWVRGRAYGTGICLTTADLHPAPGDAHNPPRAPSRPVLALRPATADGPWSAALPARGHRALRAVAAPTGADPAVPARRASEGT